jgi:hypothetical protein
LVDTFQLLSGEDFKVAMYAQGRKKIDYIFASQNLYIPFFEANDSNHCGLFIDISNALDKTKLQRSTKWMIGSKSKGSEIYEYKQEIDSLYIRHHLYEKVEEACVSTF